MAAKIGNTYAKKEINWTIIDSLLSINCTGEEIAAVIGVNYDTIQNHCKKEKGLMFSEYIKKGNDNFKVSLKRLQFRSAQGVFSKTTTGETKMIEKPSVTMQIWLGKQYLGQSDKTSVDVNSDVKKDIKNLFNEIPDE
jgi:hypothetical protein